MFFDEVAVRLKAGHGGAGCLSFRREKFLPKGGPDGGDGGKGGDVVLVGDENRADLVDYHFKSHGTAGDGEPGRGRDMHGADGADLVWPVPLGTIVISKETDRPVAEFTEHGQRVKLLLGGSGGHGNTRFKSSTNRAPRRTTPGYPGETGEYRLVLKTIADVGLVGYPNAGKSTLIGAITNAHPKTAPYPFTTLSPQVGVCEFPERYQRFRMADIPGLIEGAHENRGLGHRFLRHIERCRVLVILIDMAGTDARDPRDDYRHLLAELKAYDPALLERPRIVVANKMDEPVADENLKAFRRRHRVPVLRLSALSGEGLDELREVLRRAVCEGEVPALPKPRRKKA